MDIDETLGRLTFEEFQGHCKQIIDMTNEEIEYKFHKVKPQDIKKKYTKLLNITQEEYKANTLKTQGNLLLKQSKLQDALNKYTEAINLTKNEHLDTMLRLNIALVYIKMKEQSKAIKELNKVITLNILGID